MLKRLLLREVLLEKLLKRYNNHFTVMRKVKLIWDFRGDNTLEMANHYKKHLIEYFESKEINLIKSGVDQINEDYHLTYALVEETDVNIVKHPLKPHRALLVK